MMSPIVAIILILLAAAAPAPSERRVYMPLVGAAGPALHVSASQPSGREDDALTVTADVIAGSEDAELTLAFNNLQLQHVAAEIPCQTLGSVTRCTLPAGAHVAIAIDALFGPPPPYEIRGDAAVMGQVLVAGQPLAVDQVVLQVWADPEQPHADSTFR